MSKFRPEVGIFSACEDECINRQLNIVRGVTGKVIKNADSLGAINEAKKLKLIKPGDKICTLVSTGEGTKNEQNKMVISIVN